MNVMLWQWCFWHWNSKHVKKNIFVLLYTTTKITYNNAQTFFCSFSTLIHSFKPYRFIHGTRIRTLCTITMYFLMCVLGENWKKNNAFYNLCSTYTISKIWNNNLFWKFYLTSPHSKLWKNSKKPDFRSMCEPS